jgi:hypothetical protein
VERGAGSEERKWKDVGVRKKKGESLGGREKWEGGKREEREGKVRREFGEGVRKG